MLKKTVACLALLAASFAIVAPASADVYVPGYFRSSGAYVPSHYRSSADGYFYNNWSTKPNINPYTGSMGTRITPPSSSFRSIWGW